jgi:hypothetical protein
MDTQAHRLALLKWPPVSKRSIAMPLGKSSRFISIAMVMRCSLIVLSLFTLLFQLDTKVAFAQTSKDVLPGQGVSFSQVDFTWPKATTLNSNTGQVDVDISTLRSKTGILSGFINITTTLGWVVQNLPVFSGFPYPSISTEFKLATSGGTNITSLIAVVRFSSEPRTTAPIIAIPRQFPVSNTEFNGQGFISSPGGGAPVPPPPGVVRFPGGSPLQGCLQPEHTNIEAEVNQCGPAAVANSIQWLEDTYGIMVRLNHFPGLGDDGSLVGALDVTMNRMPGARVDALPFLSGKLILLSAENLADDLMVKHQTDLPPGGNDFVAAGVTSFGRGTPTTSFIIEEVCNGEDVELGFTSSTQGHIVQLVGAGRILGVPWIVHKSDQKQGNDNEGIGETNFDYLLDTNDTDTLPNLVNTADVPNVRLVVSESMKPACKLTDSRLGPPAEIYNNIQDRVYGLRKIEVLKHENAKFFQNGVEVPAPNFSFKLPKDLTKPVVITAQKIVQTNRAIVELKITNRVGNFCTCDPVLTTLELTSGRWIRQTFTDIPPHEHYVTVQNGNPGLKKLDIQVNGRVFKMNGLRDNEERTINVASAMNSSNNTITLTGYGKPGDSAFVLIADESGAGASTAGTSQRLFASDSPAMLQNKGQRPRHALVWGNLVSEDEEGISSRVTLKSIIAHVASQSVELIFTGPLAAKYVGPILPGYEVMVNERSRVLVQRVYQPNASSIVLVLPPRALRPGDPVSVSWYNLKDAWERPLDPGTFIIMAR